MDGREVVALVGLDGFECVFILVAFANNVKQRVRDVFLSGKIPGHEQFTVDGVALGHELMHRVLCYRCVPEHETEVLHVESLSPHP
nr:hypothetical protein [Halocatena marina]